MDKRKNLDDRTENQNPRHLDPAEKNEAQKAFREADRDIADDPEFSAKSPKDDLDEEESARLGKDLDVV